jgi:hypothetical protein
MTDIDQLGDELRDTLHVAAQEVRLPPDLAERLLTLVPAGATSGRGGVRPRRGWIRPAIAAAAAVAVIAGVTSVVAHRNSTSRPPASRAAVVPWNAAAQKALNVPVGPLPAIVTPPAQIGAPPGLRACTNLDFRLIWSQSQLGGLEGQSVLTSYRLESIATTPCSVSSYGLNAELVKANGSPLPNDMIIAGRSLDPSTLLVKPGHLVTGVIIWSVVKDKARRPVAIALLGVNGQNPRADTRLSIPIADVSAPPNPPNPSNLGPWRAGWWSQSPTVQDPAALNSLVATVIGPASVGAGQVLQAEVRLENQTPEPVSLSACPEVVVTLYVVPLKDAYVTGTRGLLNCGAAPKVVKPGASVTFAVQVPTAGEPAGVGRLTWSLVVDDRAVVQGATNVAVNG